MTGATEDERARLVRALDYPYAPPDASFELVDGRSLPLSPGEAAARLAAHGRVPLLAYGSNADPAILASKLVAGGAVTAVRVHLEGFDVVYSAHLSPYGAVPATLWSSPGTRVGVHLLLLGPRELEALDATEPNYRLGCLRDTGLEAGGTQARRTLLAYRSRHGCLEADGRALALSAVAAAERHLPAASEPEVLGLVAERVGWVGSIEDLVLRAVRDEAARSSWTAVLRAGALAQEWPGWSTGARERR